jgi:hypothetical protein
MNEEIILTIDLGTGKDDLIIRLDSSAEALAESFCSKHNLNQTIQSSLITYLYQNFKFLSESQKKKEIAKPNHKISSKSIKKLNTTEILYSEPSEKLPRTPTFEKIALPGERLYSKAMSALKLTKEKTLNATERSENNEASASKRSQSSKLHSSRGREDVLMEKFSKSKEKLDKKKVIYEKERLKECSFHPVTNHTYKRMANRSEPKNRNVFLYESYKRRQEELLNKSQIL